MFVCLYFLIMMGESGCTLFLTCPPPIYGAGHEKEEVTFLLSYVLPPPNISNPPQEPKPHNDTPPHPARQDNTAGQRARATDIRINMRLTCQGLIYDCQKICKSLRCFLVTIITEVINYER